MYRNNLHISDERIEIYQSLWIVHYISALPQGQYHTFIPKKRKETFEITVLFT